jgi:hypothetical protein
MKISSILLALLLIGGGIQAQSNFFTIVKSATTINAVAASKSIKNMKVVQLDETAIRTYLLAAPMEFSSSAPIPLQIPLPDGTTETFLVYESPVLASAIAANHPEIKTYTGNGTLNRQISMRLALTSSGFNAIMLNVNGDAVYFEKYEGVANTYFCYFAKNATIPTGSVLDRSCGLSAAEQLSPPPSSAGLTNQSPNRSAVTSLKTLRLAMAADGEFTSGHGGTKIGGYNALVFYLNRIIAFYRAELSVTYTLVSDTNLVYTNAATDPYDNTNQVTMLSQNQTNVDAVIGTANYDQAQVWGLIAHSSGGGIAYSPSVCNASYKAGCVLGEGGTPWAQVFFDQLVFHEMGHQFGMSHSYNSVIPVCTTRSASTSVEPGSGATVMSYGFTCGTDDYLANSYTTGPLLHFHTSNYSQAISYLGSVSCYTSTPTTNSPPSITMPGSFTIPKSTPFALTGSATDANGDSLTYDWEGTDIGTITPTSTTLANTALPPFFRSFEPSTSGTRIYPSLDSILKGNNYEIGNKLPSVGIVTNHRLTVRDNNNAGGGVVFGSTTVTIDGTIGPFLVTSNLSGSYVGGSTQTVTWSVNGTATATPNVKISLSTDGGKTFPTVLQASVANSGTSTVTLPNVATTKGRIKVEAVGNIFFDISNSNFTITTSAVNTWTGAVSTDWATAGNWSIAVPTSSTDGLIPGSLARYPVVGAPASVRNITINTGASLTVNASQTLSLYGNLNNSGTASVGNGTVQLSGLADTLYGYTSFGNLTESGINTTVGSDAGSHADVRGILDLEVGTLKTADKIKLISTATQTAFIKDNGGTLSGNVTIQRYVPGSTGFHEISSPLSGATLNNLSGFTISGANGVAGYLSAGTLDEYRESSNTTSKLDSGYYNYTTLSNPLTSGLGLTGKINGTSTITFSGAAATGTISHNVTKLGSNATTAGWNLIGNPYPSPISWTNLKNGNPGILNGTCYIWKPTSATSGSWQAYNGSLGIGGANDVISLSQGFMILKSASGTSSLSFNNSMRQYSLTPAFYKTSVSDEIRLTLTEGANAAEILSYTEAGRSVEFDADVDGLVPPMLTGTNANSFAFISQDQNYLINVVGEINENMEMPLAIHTSDPGIYTISAASLNVDQYPVYLLDRSTNTYHEIATKDVTFNSAGNEDKTNYCVVFSKKASATAPGEVKVNIWSTAGAIMIEQSATQIPSTIRVTNLLGQEVAYITTTDGRIELPIQTTNAIYLVSVKQNGTEIIRKVLVR